MSDNPINITLPDGAVKQYKNGTSGLQIALSISEGLARNVLAAKVNGEVWDATRPIHSDASIQLLTWNDPEGKSTLAFFRPSHGRGFGSLVSGGKTGHWPFH